MCSIIGYCGPVRDPKAFTEGFAATVSRGPDDTRIVDTGHGVLGFHRLAIMDLSDDGMQPFELDGDVVVCNGELYGFAAERALLEKKGYHFTSDSDCEILLPMYREYGTEMFKRLDAEFACVIYDGRTGEFIAARDPIGIRPLYYGYDKDGTIIFASEPKNLVGMCEHIMPFPPGCYYKGGEFHRYDDIAAAPVMSADGLEKACVKIREKLIAGVEKRLVADAKVGFLLSGGLDSSLVCAIAARKSKTPIRTFAIGMSKDAIDLKYARQVADFIGADHTEVFMTPDDVISYLPDQTYLDGNMTIRDIFALFEDFYQDFDPQRAFDMLGKLNINPDARLKTLSKGTKEKVQLILVMSRRAKLYILDEPIAGVDPAARDYILNTIISNYDPEATILISTHLIADVENVLDDVIFLQYGQIALHASVDDIRTKEGKSVQLLFEKARD